MGAHFPEMGLLREMKTSQQGCRSTLDHGNKYLLNTYSASNILVGTGENRIPGFQIFTVYSLEGDS